MDNFKNYRNKVFLFLRLIENKNCFGMFVRNFNVFVFINICGV